MAIKSQFIKKIALIVIAITVGVISFLFIQITFNIDTSSSSELDEMVININKNCPIIIDPETQLDSTSLENANHINYFYTLIQTDKATINNAIFVKSISERLLKSIIESSELEFMREKMTTFSYFYYDKNRNLIANITVTPDQYQNKR